MFISRRISVDFFPAFSKGYSVSLFNHHHVDSSELTFISQDKQNGKSWSQQRGSEVDICSNLIKRPLIWKGNKMSLCFKGQDGNWGRVILPDWMLCSSMIPSPLIQPCHLSLNAHAVPSLLNYYHRWLAGYKDSSSSDSNSFVFPTMVGCWQRDVGRGGGEGTLWDKRKGRLNC